MSYDRGPLDTDISALRLLHYRATPIDFDRSRVYAQRMLTGHAKPVGFWVSVAGEQDWPTWCQDEGAMGETLTVAHEVRLSDSAAVRLITSVEEIDRFHGEFAAPSDFDRRFGYGPEYWGIDWASVVQCYDGVVIAPYLWERRLDGGCGWYYTWDCASGCIWNLETIESVTAVAEVPA